MCQFGVMHTSFLSVNRCKDVSHIYQVLLCCIYKYIWLYSAIYIVIFLYIQVLNIYVYMHLYASMCMFKYGYNLLYTCVYVYTGLFWLAFKFHSISPRILAFGSLLLIVCLYIGMHMHLCSCVLMCMLCMLYYCASDMTAVMQSAAPIGWHSSTLWDHQCYD